jgi:hypothetical protein
MNTVPLLLTLLLGPPTRPAATVVTVVDEAGRPAAGVSVTRHLRYENGRWATQFLHAR